MIIDSFSKRKTQIVLIKALILSIFVSLLLSGCVKRNSADSDGKLRIVTTTTMLYDLVSCIGGDLVNVTALMGPGIDPHLYQASAGDVRRMQNADIIVYNGLHLEGKMGDIFGSLARTGRKIICAEDGLDYSLLLSDETNPNIHDPHIWFNVSLWQAVARHVSKRLMEIDPENEETYIENLDNYLKDLDELIVYIHNRIEEVAHRQRVLVTAHDAFRYFGREYGFEVLGLQGISTDAEAGTADVSNLAAYIAENQIKAIFIESSVPARNIEALQAAVIARGFNVHIGGELYSDSLGDSSSGHDTYILTFKANIDTIVDALK
ncbi:MAG: zinc ABC transporter substrate-binding protein [Candidatus Cloacimonetes bacterium]|nr:zinc ABC transporter substrate-binding protein [Candidatus Cloacimonadota bacterium]